MYLKPNVVIEPVIDRWFAWSHLISPATMAMNITGRHIPIMQSYIMAPDVHQQAVMNPKMLGGPFMNYATSRKADVEDLLKMTRTKRAKLIELSDAVKELDSLLQAEATGFSLQPLYEKIPDVLKGYVDLHYDRNNNPGFRLFESLLYQSEYYQKDAQGIALWITNNDHRPFVLSTPRLDEPDTLFLDIPFDHSGIDALAKMKKSPQSIEHISNLLSIKTEQRALFNTFFTDQAPEPYKKYTGDKIRMRYFGHACILVETKNISLLIDPVISYYGYQSDIERFSDIDLPDEIDYVLISHNHQDHVLLETLLPLRHRIKNLIVPRTYGGKLEDPDLKLMFKQLGFKNVTDLGIMETINDGDAQITPLPFTGEHADLDVLAKACFMVTIDGFKLLFFADSKILEPALYEHVHKFTGDVDVVFLGMECDGAPLTWLYGPLMTKKLPRDKDISRRLSGSDCNQGLSVVEIFHPKELYVYAMGQEPWIEFISSIKYTDESNPIVQSNKLIELCHQKGILGERLFGEKELLYDRQFSFVIE